MKEQEITDILRETNEKSQGKFSMENYQKRLLKGCIVKSLDI